MCKRRTSVVSPKCLYIQNVRFSAFFGPIVPRRMYWEPTPSPTACPIPAIPYRQAIRPVSTACDGSKRGDAVHFNRSQGVPTQEDYRKISAIISHPFPGFLFGSPELTFSKAAGKFLSCSEKKNGTCSRGAHPYPSEEGTEATPPLHAFEELPHCAGSLVLLPGCCFDQRDKDRSLARNSS